MIRTCKKCNVETEGSCINSTVTVDGIRFPLVRKRPDLQVILLLGTQGDFLRLDFARNVKKKDVVYTLVHVPDIIPIEVGYKENGKLHLDFRKTDPLGEDYEIHSVTVNKWTI